MNIEFIPEEYASNSDDFMNFKIIIIGEAGVGKSCILKRAAKNNFDKDSLSTHSFEYLFMNYLVNGLKIKLQIWDTMGQEIYRSVVQGFYRNASLVILVYDITRKESYKSLDFWIKDVRSRTDTKMPIFIVGNKYDLEDSREIAFNVAKEYSVSKGAKFFTECSAKTGYKVENIFEEVAKYLYNTKKGLGKTNNSNKLKISSDNGGDKKKKKKCC